MSLFITFEGGEGSGKSVHSRRLYRRLLKNGFPTVLTCEPGGTTVGRKIARWIKWNGDSSITPVAELMLFNAARAQSVNQIIKPALENSMAVISDRYTDSTTAYQGYGRMLDTATVLAVNNAATGVFKPSLTVLLDVPVEVGLKRKDKNSRDRFEREEFDFHQRVRDGYLRLAANEPSRWLVIDGTQSRDIIAGVIWQKVSRLLEGL